MAATRPKVRACRGRSSMQRPYCPASVATSFQLGSREERSRAKVHTSVTSVTLSGLPSITLPSLSRVTETSCETKRTVTCAVLVLHVGGGDVRLVDRDEPRLGLLAARFAILDGLLEAIIDLLRQEVLERAPVTLRVGRHDHLVGGAPAGQEVAWIEARVLRHHGIETERSGRALLGDALPPVGRFRVGGRGGSGFSLARRQRDHIVVARGAGRFARRIGVIGRPFAPGALAQHAAQPQENEHCERQKDDRVDVEQVARALGLWARPPAPLWHWTPL